MRSFVVLISVLLASPVAAQDTMTADQFDAYVTGRTITYRSIGNPAYGVERYLPGRRVMWSRFDGVCQYGVWYESKGDICFRYDGDPKPKCWAVYHDPTGIRSLFTNDPNGSQIWENTARDDPLICHDLSS